MTTVEDQTERTWRPWLESVDDVVAELGTDPSQGLSSDEAATRLDRHGPNRLDAAPPVPAWRKVLAQLDDPLVLLLIAAVVVSLVAWAVEGADGVPYEAIVIAVIVAMNAVLGYVQGARAERAVEALQRMAAPHATVRRDGREQRIPATEVVPGDVLVLAQGDAVSADARLIEAASLEIAEAALTGESQPVEKGTEALSGEPVLGDRSNMAFKGTAVTRGRGVAVVTATGMGTEMGRVAKLLGATTGGPTPLQREVALLGRTLGIAVIVIAVVIVGTIVLTSDLDGASDVVDVLLVGVSLAVAAVPEGLPAILSVVLALGVQRMARKNAIVKTLSSVETLGSASVICTDKTGTLTRNEMTITRVVTGSGSVTITGTGFRPEGEILEGDRPLGPGPLHDEVRRVLHGGSLANDAVLHETDGHWEVHGDPTEGAFLVAERKLGDGTAAREVWERIAEVPFTSERKLMTTLHVDGERDGLVTAVTKGAPDVLLARCSHEWVAGEVRPLTDERRAEILAMVDELADQALRTLAVAERQLPDGEPPPGDELGDHVERDLVYLGLVGMIDPPRDEVRDSVAEAHGAGLRVLMITGDHPRTAHQIAVDLGIAEPGSAVMTGADLQRTGREELRERLADVTVFARVAPEHKLDIVGALQDGGAVVAMTGDGVNDAPALKAADIGVAMGITGTDVAKEAADMILVDDDFSTIVAAIREGRGIFSDIKKFLRYLLSSNVGEVLTMFLGVVFAGLLGLDDSGDEIAVPLLATHILWINLLTDTGPALAMGVDPPPPDVMSRPPRRLDERIVDAEMQLGIVFVGLVMAAVTLLALDLRLPGGLVEGSGDLEEARTMAFTTLVLAQLFNCLNSRSDRQSAFVRMFTNPLLWAAMGLSLVLQVAVVHLPLLNDAFGTSPLGLDDWVICTLLASAVLWADELKKLLLGAVRRGSPPEAAAGV